MNCNLRPCPFCGGNNTERHALPPTGIECADCGGRAPDDLTWNKRWELPKSMVHRLATQMGWSPPARPSDPTYYAALLTEARRVEPIVTRVWELYQSCRARDGAVEQAEAEGLLLGFVRETVTELMRAGESQKGDAT